MNLEAWRCHLRARLFEFLRQTDKAMAEYRTALDLDPSSARATRVLAFLLASRGHFAEAEPVFPRSPASGTATCHDLFNLGFLCE